MSDVLARVRRVYRNHHLDSTRWEVFEPRDGDIIVTTAYKAGTTWTQQILRSLLQGPQASDPKAPRQMHQDSPWVDARFMGTTKEQLAGHLSALPDRRFVKSHLPLDGLPYYPQVKYLIVARDPRDVFMSLLNHYAAYTDLAYATLNGGEREGEPFPRLAASARELFYAWITRGWFAWESEGWPFWGNMAHTQSYWDYRHLPNFLFMHYSDLLADLEGAVRRLAAFTGIAASDADIARTVEDTTFANVKRKADEQTRAAPPEDDKTFFRGGASTFFFKGKNGRWRELLTEQDLALYEAAKTRVLSPACARWLERGGAPAR